jgi:hypothetical protein
MHSVAVTGVAVAGAAATGAHAAGAHAAGLAVTGAAVAGAAVAGAAVAGAAGPAGPVGTSTRTAGTAASAVETAAGRSAPDRPERARVERSDVGFDLVRRELGPLRHRFLLGRLPPLGHLLIRQRLAVPGGCEAPWVLATSWPVPGRLHGRYLNDAVHPELAHIRMGRTVWVSVDNVIDWVVLNAASEIVEGGWSRRPSRALDLADPPSAPSAQRAGLVPEQSVAVPEWTQSLYQLPS